MQPPIRAAISVGGVLDLVYADEEGLGGGAGAVARFLGYLGLKCLERFDQSAAMMMLVGLGRGWRKRHLMAVILYFYKILQGAM